MSAVQPRNSFRAAVLRGEKPELVVTDKDPQRGNAQAVKGLLVSRAETRRSDHRGKDRHRLTSESVTARYKNKKHKAELINLSSGGAQIRCAFKPRLWEIVELDLGGGPQFEGAVRWIKGDRVGLEFAHETRIECGSKERAELLLEVIQRSFPDQTSIDGPEPEEIVAEPQEDLGARVEKRHPLIWKGEIHYAFDTKPVRLRNVSEGGALIEVSTFYPVGAEVMLDLGDAGQFDALVTWGEEDQVGLKFAKAFDIACLAKARPDVTPQSWQVPGFLDGRVEDDSPWHTKWKRSSIAEIRTELEGYLKR